MSAAEPISKVDSAVSDVAGSPTDEKSGHRRKSSSVTGVYNVQDLEKEGKDLLIAPETQKLNWKLNTSPTTLGEPDTLKKPLTTPPVKRIDLHFPLGLEVTARNLKGVTIKDALDAIYKQYRKKADDELELPVLAGFEWDKEESWTRLVVHQKKEGQASGGGKKKKGKKGEEEE